MMRNMNDEFNSNTTTCNLFGEFYHKSFFAWKILVFEFYLTWLRTEVPGVEDDIAAGVETSNVDQAGVGVGDVGDDHVPVATVEVPFQEDQTVVLHEMNLVIINFFSLAVTVRVTCLEVSIHKDGN